MIVRSLVACLAVIAVSALSGGTALSATGQTAHNCCTGGGSGGGGNPPPGHGVALSTEGLLLAQATGGGSGGSSNSGSAGSKGSR